MGKFIDLALQQTPPKAEISDVSVEDTGSLFAGEQGNVNLIQLDGDTFADGDGNKYRLQGAHAPETTKVTLGRERWTTDVRDIDIKEGQPFGESTNTAVQQVIAAGGFNRMVKTGEKDQYGRETISMTNDKGEDLTQALYRAGVLKPTPFTSEEMLRAYEDGELARQMGYDTGYDAIMRQLDEDIENATIRSEGKTGIALYAGDLIGDATDEADRVAIREGSGIHNIVDDPIFNHSDRDKNNVARNSLGTSAYTGWLGMKEGFYGAAELLGAREFGQAGLTRLEAEQLGLPQVENLSFDEVNGAMDFVQYLGNNMAMSAPYLGLSIGAGLLAAPVGAAAAGAGLGAGTAALVGSGAAAVPSSLVYAGQIYNEMEGEKNAGAALAGGFAAGLIERLGLELLFKPASLLTSTGQELLERTVIESGKAATQAEAKALIFNASKAEVSQLLTTMANGAGQQAASFINRGNLMKGAAVGALKGGVSEGLTEGAQETIQYATAALASDREFNQWELEDRLQDALLAGASLGAGFGSAGDVWAYADRHSIEVNLQKANREHLNHIDRLREDLRAESDVPLESVDDILDRTQKDVAKWLPEQEALRETDRANREKGKRTKKKSQLGGLNDRANRHQKNEKGFLNTIQNVESIPDGIAKAITGVGKLVNAASTTAFKIEHLSNPQYGQIMRDIRALVGQTRGVINPGRSFEAKTDWTYGNLAKMVYMPDVFNRFKVRDNAKGRDSISKVLREYGAKYHKGIEDGTIAVADLPAGIREHAAALRQTANELESMANNIWGVQDVANKKDGGNGVGYTEGWWYKHRDFDPAKVQKNKDGWFDFMRKHTNMTDQDLREFYDRIVGGDAGTVQDFFSHVRGIEFQPGQHMRRDAKLSEQDGFDAFGRDDMFSTLDSAAQSAARYATNREYFGAGGKNLDYLFQQLEDAGMSQKEVDEVAWYTKSIIDSASGNFNRITNYRWAAVQKFASTWAIFAGLPLSTLSSIPESAMVAMGMTSNEIAGAASKVGQEIAQAFGETLKDVGTEMVKNKEIQPVDNINDTGPKKSQQALNEAGLYWTNASVAKRMGVGETNISHQWLQDKFFKGIGLTALTQGQRRAAAAVTTDFVTSRLANLAQVSDTKYLNNQQQHEYNQLAELGMEVDTMIELFKDYANTEGLLDYVGEHRDVPPDVMEIIDRNMQQAVYNFTNLRVQNPGAANRPLFFQDPHYQMLTQFNGFISTFTANVVPKLWNDYVKRGTPAMKYHTFALMMTMMGMGAASQYLKDMIKYGRVSPYLSDGQQLQRAIYSSGVLGQAERVVDIAFPLYGGRPRSSIDWALDTIIGESGPTVRNVGNIMDAVGASAAGEYDRAANKLQKVTPLLGAMGGAPGEFANIFLGDLLQGHSKYEDIGR